MSSNCSKFPPFAFFSAKSFLYVYGHRSSFLHVQFPSGDPKEMGIEVGGKSMQVLERDILLSLLLFLIWSLPLLICEICQWFLFSGPQFPWVYKEDCAK